MNIKQLPTTTIHLANESFNIPTSLADDARRVKAFNDIAKLPSLAAELEKEESAATAAPASQDDPQQSGGNPRKKSETRGASPAVSSQDPRSGSRSSHPQGQPVSTTSATDPQPPQKSPAQGSSGISGTAYDTSQTSSGRASLASIGISMNDSASINSDNSHQALTERISPESQYNRKISEPVRRLSRQIQDILHQNLHDEELRLLDYLGMDMIIIQQLAPHLAEFFRSLPSCSTDTRLTQDSRCETAYFVIWATLNSAYKEAEKRMKQWKAEFMIDRDVAMTDSLLRDIDKVFPEDTSGIPDVDIYRLFTIGTNLKTGSEYQRVAIPFWGDNLKEVADFFTLKTQEEEAIERIFRMPPLISVP